jgi:hypothetical protein
MAARSASLDDLKAQLRDWLDTVAKTRVDPAHRRP